MQYNFNIFKKEVKIKIVFFSLFQLLTGEPQSKIKHAVPILGMLQISKSSILKNNLNLKSKLNQNEFNGNADNDLFDPPNSADHHENNNLAENQIPDKNPMINKRILLNSERQLNGAHLDQSNDIEMEPIVGEHLENIDQNQINNFDDKKESISINNTEQVFVAEVPQNILRQIDKIKFSKPMAVPMVATIGNSANTNPTIDINPLTEGRMVVYGDSNCLDSTHAEKPCFWLLDALLEYTMTSHVSTLLKDLNRSAAIQFGIEPIEMPKRLPNNNLHMYSKVLMADIGGNGKRDSHTHTSSSTNFNIKRDIPKCVDLRWETPIFLNLTTPNDLQHQNGKDKDDLDVDGAIIANALNLRRKLESQKGEVRSVLIFNL